MLKISYLNSSYRQKALPKNVNLALENDVFIGILGLNGSGKSIPLNLILKSLEFKEKEIALFNTNIKHLSLKEFAKVCGFVPQNSKLNAPLKVIDALLMSKYTNLKHTFSSYSKKDILELETLAEELKTGNFLQRSILSLGGEEFQKAPLARALLRKPKILFLDEPTSALDLNHAIELSSLCERLIKCDNIGVIAILHDLNLASLFCDKIIFSKNGEIGHFGTSKELLTKEILKEIHDLNCELIYKNPKPYVLALKEAQ